MPYIEQKDRERFASTFEVLEWEVDGNGISNGDLNYLITKLGLLYLKRHGTSYNILSDVVKAMECAKLEFYRRHVAPYEDTKMQENGDV